MSSTVMSSKLFSVSTPETPERASAGCGGRAGRAFVPVESPVQGQVARFPTEASSKCGTIVANTGRLFERPTFRLKEFRFLKFITCVAAMTYELR
jgi:hypothetical protein